MLNHPGALHAGVQAALLDTACGYAAGTVAGNVVTLQLNLQFLSSAKGDRFEARARVTKAGKAWALRGRGADHLARPRGGAGGRRDGGAGEGGLKG
ncbi:MAG TPA: PaaI family thioesterase [Allosphingosinicella sp.]|nr:PaaI family thioesterase [Allosphingosinicella sp.]